MAPVMPPRFKAGDPSIFRHFRPAPPAVRARVSSSG
jgi:hypothetical protein